MILAAGLSPAWQQILSFDDFAVGEVNRAQSVHWCASGKVVNVAIACAHLGEETSLISCNGGRTGQSLADDVHALGVKADWIEVEHPTRVCTTILQDNGPTTELVENAAPVSESVLDDFLNRVRRRSRSADVVVVTGSLPSNASFDYYHQLISETPAKLVLDFRGEGLMSCLPLKPLIVKPNREELAQTVGRPLHNREELLGAMNELNRQGAQWVVVSDGPGSVWATSMHVTYQLIPPAVDVVNPIGCGDCLAAGIASELRRSKDVIEAIKFGIAAASLNATMLLPGRLSRQSVLDLAGSVRVAYDDSRGV